MPMVAYSSDSRYRMQKLTALNNSNARILFGAKDTEAHRIDDANARYPLSVIATQQKRQVDELLASKAQFRLKVRCAVLLHILPILKDVPGQTYQQSVEVCWSPQQSKMSY